MLPLWFRSGLVLVSIGQVNGSPNWVLSLAPIRTLIRKDNPQTPAQSIETGPARSTDHQKWVLSHSPIRTLIQNDHPDAFVKHGKEACEVNGSLNWVLSHSPNRTLIRNDHPQMLAQNQINNVAIQLGFWLAPRVSSVAPLLLDWVWRGR